MYLKIAFVFGEHPIKTVLQGTVCDDWVKWDFSAQWKTPTQEQMLNSTFSMCN